MRMLIALLFVVPLAWAQFCADNEIPDKIAVNDNGDVALGCRFNECPRGINDAGVKTDVTPKCGKNFYELSCPGPLQWVGGIPRGSNLNNVVPLQCCTAQQLADAPHSAENRKIVELGQVFEGQVYYDRVGNVKGYDIVKNAQKIKLTEGKYAISVTVGKLMCNRKDNAMLLANDDYADHGFGDVVADPEGDQAFQFPGGGFGDLGSVGAGFGGPVGAPGGSCCPHGPVVCCPAPAPPVGTCCPAGPITCCSTAGHFNDLGPAIAPPPLNFGAPALPLPAPALPPPLPAFPAPLPLEPLPLAPPAPLLPPAAPALGVLGAAGGAGAVCFHGDTVVETPSGPKKMEDLKIGDQVLAVSNEKIVGFSPVKSFLHRLPNKDAEFYRITAGDSSVSLTALHFIYTTPCNSVEPTMKYAKDVKVGECLVRINGERQTPVLVQSNEVFRSTGIYNPMTGSGTIVADGFMASIYNVYQDTSFMNTLMGTAQSVQKMFYGEHQDNHVELPWALQYVIDYASKIL